MFRADSATCSNSIRTLFLARRASARPGPNVYRIRPVVERLKANSNQLRPDA